MKEIQSDIKSIRVEVIRLSDGWKVITSGAAEAKSERLDRTQLTAKVCVLMGCCFVDVSGVRG